MALSKAQVDALVQLSSILKQDHELIGQVKASMDNELKSFVWNDPVGRAFIAKYYEDLKPIEGKLIPNLISYCQYLDKEAQIIGEYGTGTL